MGLMPVTDSMFMLPESREQPMHVGGLQVFDLPEGSGPEWLTEAYQRSVSLTDVAPAFRRRAYRSPLTPGAVGVGRGPLARPRAPRAALRAPPAGPGARAVRARLPAARHAARPRAAAVGGRTSSRASRATGSPSTRRSTTRSWTASPRRGCIQQSLDDVAGRPVAPAVGGAPRAGPPARRAGRARRAARAGPSRASDAVALPPRGAEHPGSACRTRPSALPGQAPRSVLNGSISASRRFAGDAWSLARLRAVAKAADATINDVVLAMCSAALRDYLQSLDALPDAPLIAMTPVSPARPRRRDDGGNAVGTILCNLATDLDDPSSGCWRCARPCARARRPARAVAGPGDRAVRRRHGPAAAQRPHRAAPGGAAAVQPRHLQRARAPRSRCTGTARGCRAPTRCRSRCRARP